ncbi:MAG: toll/interleukin-1 receptor domain-containing protein, partial [Singulisphaera sp.]|nr:toll/interleukin-1 receptor domain-containing protein [Singulisphaera sp.]
VGELRAVGFEVWFDEERINVADNIEREIEEGIHDAHHGIFIVTREWLKREWTQFEINQFTHHHPSAARDRRVAVVRDPIAKSELPHHFVNLAWLRWDPSEANPKSLLWRLYCALTGAELGPSEDWEQNWDRLRGGGVVAPAAPPAPSERPVEPPPERAERWLHAPDPPVFGVAGLGWIYLETESGAWLRANADCCESIVEFQNAAAVAELGQGVVAVGLYDQQVALLDDDQTLLVNMEAPVLALACTRDGFAAGDAEGWLTLVTSRDKARQRVRCPSAVVGLWSQPDEGLIVALGINGELGQVVARGSRSKPSYSALKPLKEIDRPCGLFDAGAKDRVGIAGTERLAIYDLGQDEWETNPLRFEGGIWRVVPLRGGGLGVLTDTGFVWITEPRLRTASDAVLVGRDRLVRGIVADQDGLFAWTTAGDLFAVGRERVVRRLPVSSVRTLVPDRSGVLQVVQWKPTRGVRVAPVTMYLGSSRHGHP